MKDLCEAKARLRGLFNITVTPFAPDGSIDVSVLTQNIERVIDLGFDGILIGGTYGEFPSMNETERATLFREAMNVVADRVPVMLCSAHSDSRVVAELTALAGELGGFPLVTPPYVSEITHDQILEVFHEMSPLSRPRPLFYTPPPLPLTFSPPPLP